MVAKRIGDFMDPADRYGIHVLNLETKRWETIRPLTPIAEEQAKLKTLEEKIDEYLDVKGIFNPEIRAGLMQLIKEHEEE